MLDRLDSHGTRREEDHHRAKDREVAGWSHSPAPSRRPSPRPRRSRPGKSANPLASERIAAILDALARTYPNVVCALNHSSAWELTVATILSAQCTDVRVNLVTPRAVQSFPHTQGDGCCLAARTRRVDPHHRLLSQQGQVHQGRGAGCRRAVRQPGSADHGRDVEAPWSRPQDRQRSAGIVVPDRRRSGSSTPMFCGSRAASN